MKTRVLITLSLSVWVVILGVSGCKQKSLDDVDLAYHHSPEGVHEKLQEQKMVLTDALERQDLVFIHNQAYYVQGLVDALAAKLEGEKKERLAPVFEELSQRIDKVHDAAGSGKAAATETGLQELFAALKRLEPEFKPGKRK